MESKLTTAVLIGILIMLGITLFISLAGIPKINLKKIPPAQETQKAGQQPSFVKEIGNFYKFSDEPYTDGEKVSVVFIGAEFCPFCAAERWPVVESLGSLGTFSGLKETKSASAAGDFSEIPTYDFLGIHYSSNSIDFYHKETADRNYNPLQTLTVEEQRLFDSYNPRGSIPFLFIGGKKGIFVQVGSGYSPGTISGMQFSQLQSDIATQPDSPAAKSIQQEAEKITALICYNLATPTAACENPSIKNLIAQLH